MKRIPLFIVLIASLIVVASGQDDYKKGEFFVGYSMGIIDVRHGVDSPHHGFNVSGVYNLTRKLGVKGGFSGTFKTETFGTTNSSKFSASIYNVLGGIQIKDNSKDKKVKPFFHALAGVGILRLSSEFNGSPSFDDTETGFATAVGGGIDFKVNEKISIRAVQVDYNPMWIGGGSVTHNVRIGVGIVF